MMEYCSAMLEESRDFSWETSVRMSCVGRDVEDLGLMLEGGRKRKWQEGGKMMRREEAEEREQRRMPPKKIIGEFKNRIDVFDTKAHTDKPLIILVN